MRVKLVAQDNFVSIDGVEFFNVDLSSLAPDVSAVQWYGNRGEIERKDSATGKMIGNESITSIDFLRSVLDKCVVVTPPQPTAQEISAQRANEARAQRNFLLAGTDWVITKAFESATAVPQAWATYRQALRDVPQQPGFPENIQWPVKPE